MRGRSVAQSTRRIGIGEKRVSYFFKNAEVLESVGDLPRAVFGIVERICRFDGPFVREKGHKCCVICD